MMIGETVKYVIRRTRQKAALSVESTLMSTVWIVAAGLFALLALGAALITAYLYLEPIVGRWQAAGIVTLGCLVLAIVCVIVKWIYDAQVESRQRKISRSLQGLGPVEVVEREANAIVDTVGSVKIIAGTFLLGFVVAQFARRERTAPTHVDLELRHR